ncbi:helix-turn-helix domain-containing protein [Enterococcus sp. DIV0840c]|uniref:helix-turn-helix domain-containing protein n=1 Tax=Enterococcus sp. DIV0840c TaxID=2774772 RepID=UPI003D26B3CB
MKNLQLLFLTNKEAFRWLIILSILERTRTCTAQRISERTNISTRTLIKDMQGIRAFFDPSIELTTSNSGYVLEIRNYKEYHSLKRELIENDPLFVLINSILIGDLHTVEEWAFRFHLSESTMKRHILSVTHILNQYELQFSLTPVDIVGPEVNIRKFFKDFYYEVEITPHVLLPFEEVRDLFFHLDENVRKNLETNVSPSDFQYFLYIMIQRSKKGKRIPEIQINFDYLKNERQFLSFLKENILRVYEYQISDNELNVLYIYLMSQRRITQVKEESTYCKRFGNSSIEKHLAKKFIESYEEHLGKKSLGCEFFVLLESFFISLSWLSYIGEIIHKSSLSVINFCKEKYPEECAFTVSFLKDSYQQISESGKYYEDIAVSLVLTIEAIRDIYVRNPHKIAVLIEGSYYIRRMIEAKLLRYLRGYHQIFFPTIEEMTQAYFDRNQVDLFVTNQEEYITELVANIDFILLKSLPDAEDWNELLTRINPQITKDFSIGKSLSINN